jgi:hypothetical protein
MKEFCGFGVKTKADSKLILRPTTPNQRYGYGRRKTSRHFFMIRFVQGDLLIADVQFLVALETGRRLA